MSSMFNNLINKIKLKKTLNNIENKDEYAFSVEEIDILEKTNHQKIKKLKENIIGIKEKDEVIITNNDNIIDGLEKLSEVKEEVDNKIFDDEKLSESEESQIDKYLEEINKPDDLIIELEEKELDDNKEIKVEKNDSFVNLSKEHQDLIMNSWNEINLNEIDKDIINGKDILNHNYNITYGDNAAKFVHDIRKKYEVVIYYLIGFNNEKNGIMNKTIFSDKVDNEWKYLDNYIKLLEKIRNFRK